MAATWVQNPNRTDGLFDFGDFPLMTATFKQNGTPTNPGGGPFCKMTDPLGNKTQPTLTNTSAGVYTFSINLNVSGTWTFRVYAPPGNGQASTDYYLITDVSSNP